MKRYLYERPATDVLKHLSESLMDTVQPSYESGTPEIPPSNPFGAPGRKLPL